MRAGFALLLGGCSGSDGGGEACPVAFDAFQEVEARTAGTFTGTWTDGAQDEGLTLTLSIDIATATGDQCANRAEADLTLDASPWVLGDINVQVSDIDGATSLAGTAAAGLMGGTWLDASEAFSIEATWSDGWSGTMTSGTSTSSFDTM